MRWIFFTFLGLLLLSFVPQPATAVTIISPVVEVSVEPGGSQAGVLKLFNETAEPKRLQATVEAMETDDESGTPRVVVGPRPDFLTWFTFEYSDVALAVGQAAVVPFRVTVPPNATPGGYYAAVFWEEFDAADGGNVQVASRVGTLVLLTVTGELDYRAELAEFSLAGSTGWRFALPVEFTIRVANTGNVHIRPRGTIAVRNWQGDAGRLVVNPQQRSIIAGSTRRLQLQWGEAVPTSGWKNFLEQLQQEVNLLPLGKHTATLQLEYGTAEQPQQFFGEVEFFVLPVRLLCSLGGLVVFVALLLLVNRKVKKFRQRHVRAS